MTHKQYIYVGKIVEFAAAVLYNVRTTKDKVIKDREKNIYGLEVCVC